MKGFLRFPSTRNSSGQQGRKIIVGDTHVALPKRKYRNMQKKPIDESLFFAYFMHWEIEREMGDSGEARARKSL